MDYITIEDNNEIHLHGFEQLTDHVILFLGKRMTIRTANKRIEELLPSEWLIDFDHNVGKNRIIAEEFLKREKKKIPFVFIDGVYYES